MIIKQNMIKLVFLFVSILFIGFMFFPNSALAAGLVPCGPGIEDNPTCEVCDLFTLIDNIIKFISIDVGPILALILIVIGAIVMMTSAGSEDRFKKGKEIITAALIGIFIIWGSWLIIDTVMKAFLKNQDYGPWNEVNC